MNRLGLLCLIVLFVGCKSIKNSVNNFNVFPVSEDVRLGKQVDDEIRAVPDQFPIAPRNTKNSAAYKYLDGLVNTVLNSGKIVHKDDFPWKVSIIKDDVVNAFATPGGYIYVYTGLIEILDDESELIGVLAHEIAHADQRHSTKQMTKSIGVQALVEAALGDQEALKNVTGSLVALQFSRSHETEADKYAVNYMCGTKYKADGVAGFFKKIGDQPQPPEFMSTHPNPANRVEAIDKEVDALGCTGGVSNASSYGKFKQMIQNLDMSGTSKAQNTGGSNDDGLGGLKNPRNTSK